MNSEAQAGVEAIRLLLADDHPQVREQLAARLEREPGIDLVGAASHSLETLQIAIERRPSVLLIDPMMRDGLGLEVLAQAAAGIPELRIVILTAFIDTTLDMQLRALGICQILVKGISTPDLLAELRSAARV